MENPIKIFKIDDLGVPLFLETPIWDSSQDGIFDIPFLKLTFSHLEMDGWNTILSYWVLGPIFRGELLVSGSVFDIPFLP